AISVVDGIGLVEARDHALDARRPIDLERHLAAGDPGLQPDLGQPADMIGVQMGDQHAVDPVERHFPELQVARGIHAGIDEIEMRARGDHGAGTGAADIGKRRPRSDQQDRQFAVVGELRVAAGYRAAHDLPEQPGVERSRLHGDGAGRNDSDNRDDGPDSPASHLFFKPFCFSRHSRTSSRSWPKNGSPSNAIVGTPQWPAARCAFWFSWMMASYLSGSAATFASSAARSRPAREAAFAR